MGEVSGVSFYFSVVASFPVHLFDGTSFLFGIPSFTKIFFMTSCLLRLRVKDCFALFRFFQSDVLNKPSSQRLGSFVLNGRRSSFPRV